LFYQLQQAGVSLLCGSTPLRIFDKGMTVVFSNGEEKQVLADNVVSCIGFRPRRELYKNLKNTEEDWDVYAIGDCVRVENLYHAIQSAFQLAQRI
jgi:hypothetical protein